MLRTYEYNGLTYQYEEGHQPKGAKLVRPKQAPASKQEPRPKARAPRNKAKAPADK